MNKKENKGWDGMAIAPKYGKLLYHITQLSNIPSIYKYGLCSRDYVYQSKIKFVDIADHEILDKRDLLPTPLSHYIPFHFFVKNPFDGDVCTRFGSDNMAIIAINRSLHRTYKFWVSPKHPLGSRAHDSIFPYLEGIERIDWDKMDPANDRDYNNPEIKSTCMAECLVDSVSISFSDFAFVYVRTEHARDYIAANCGMDALRKVKVEPKMFPDK